MMFPLSETYRPSKNYATLLAWFPPYHRISQGIYLSDILVLDHAYLLDICRGLGNVLEGVSSQHQLILDILRGLDLNAGKAVDTTHDLLANEVSDH